MAGASPSKPYVASGAYIDRMSDYCGRCAYRVTERSSPKACPFNALYWHYLTRHRARFGRHPRMAVIYKGWDARPAGRSTGDPDHRRNPAGPAGGGRPV